MFNSSFYESIKQHNLIINNINCVLRKIEKDIDQHVKNDPSIILYSYEPLEINRRHYFSFDYPNIIFSVTPLKIIIPYKEVIKKVEKQISNSNAIEKAIEQIVLDYLCI